MLALLIKQDKTLERQQQTTHTVNTLRQAKLFIPALSQLVFLVLFGLSQFKEEL
ncbi:MAG: hypothetical protein SOY94_11825 [Candidatus Limiplasma sp.]|nr:hypothetical protein [Candidatus Limiplasma sp.]